MPMVKVWNDNVHPYTEEFTGQKIVIPAKKFVMMEKGEANLFRGTFSSPQRDGDGQQLPTSYKMIRLEEVTGEKEELKTTAGLNRCNLCGYESSDQTDLLEHAKSQHSESFYVDPSAEEALKGK